MSNQKSDEGQNINDQDDEGQTRLYLAVRYGHLDQARILLAEGANPNIPETKDGWTPLIVTIRVTKNIDIIHLLLSYGADPLILSHSGRNAWVYARQLRRSHPDFSRECIQLFDNWPNIMERVDSYARGWRERAIFKRRTRERNLSKYVMRKIGKQGTHDIDDKIKKNLNHNNTPLIF
jgi:hypothetical protein